jgi:hypothetical protein
VRWNLYLLLYRLWDGGRQLYRAKERWLPAVIYWTLAFALSPKTYRVYQELKALVFFGQLCDLKILVCYRLNCRGVLRVDFRET